MANDRKKQVNSRPQMHDACVCRKCGGLISKGVMIEEVKWQRDDGSWPKYGAYYHRAAECPNAFNSDIDRDEWWSRQKRVNEAKDDKGNLVSPLDPNDFVPIGNKTPRWAPTIWTTSGETDPYSVLNHNYKVEKTVQPTEYIPADAESIAAMMENATFRKAMIKFVSEQQELALQNDDEDDS